MTVIQKWQLKAARRLLEHVAGQVEAKVSVRLWDGSEVPLGTAVEPGLAVSISGPGVISSLIRRPTPDNLFRHYALKNIDFHGADLFTFIEKVRVRRSREKSRGVSRLLLARSLLPFLFSKPKPTVVSHRYQGDETGRGADPSENKDFIQFHYDLSNDFYSLFLDPQMVYTCAYFKDWSNSLEQAQRDKLDMICRKLRLQPGERFLDIGCGWGGLICHAAQHYGVIAHGVTLSAEQVSFARLRIEKLGLQDRVTVELRDCAELSGTWDKIASIGVIEHVGIDNMGKFMAGVNRLLPDRGLFLCHGITRPAKKNSKDFRKLRPERRLLAKYIFPGGELDHLGHVIDSMEAHKFEVHDVEGWRDHYALTCKLWCQELTTHADEAIRLVGEERYRMWIAYLAGVSFALGDGSARLFQALATKHASKGHSGMPPTREYLYDTPARAQTRRAA